jgi:hypothetical protein
MKTERKKKQDTLVSFALARVAWDKDSNIVIARLQTNSIRLN